MVSSAPPSEEALPRAIDRVWETVPPLWFQIRANVRAIARQRFGISVQQFRILRHICRGVRSVSELASVSQTSRPAVSQWADQLVGKGLVTRRRSARDRRYVELEATQSGLDMLNAVFEENHRWMAQRLASLTPEQLDGIVEAMGALGDAFIG